MAIGLTEEHDALRESVRGWAERHVPLEVRRASEDGSEGERRPPFWTGLAEQGLLGLHLPEERGGQGAGLLELAVVVEELGRALVPGPYLPTVLAGAVLARSSGSADGDLAALADGSRTGAVALGTGLHAEPDGPGGYRVGGEIGAVLGAAGADILVLGATIGEGPDEVWFVVPAADVKVTAADGLDLGRGMANVTVDHTVSADAVLSGISGGRVRDLAAVLFGAEAAGIAGWCLDTAASYAKVREQFGRPIGQFQAVKHRCAQMLLEAEQARAAVWDAARAWDGGAPEDEARLAAAVTGTVAPDAAVRCAYDCVQVLGGIGYTWEHDAHRYLRRAHTLRALLGRCGQWSARAADEALAGVRRTLEVELPAGAENLRDEVRREAGALAAMERGEQRRRLADDGWVLPHLPKPWGRDAGPVEQVVIAQEFRAAGLPRVDLLIGAWAAPTLVQHGTVEQQERFLPATLRGEITWCQLFSEPGAGSDLASLAMRAERVDGGWKLSGQKIWTSLAHVADWAICLARTEPAAASKHDGITYFLVDMKSPGLQVRQLTEITGDAFFNEVFLDGVFVPDDCVVGEVDKGWRLARTTLANERVALSTGWSLAGVKELLDLARLLDLSDADKERVGQLVCESQAFSLLGLRGTLMRVSGTEPGPTSSVRKLLGMRHGQRVAECGWELLGTGGALTSGPGAYWSRLLLSSRALSIGGGTTEVQLNIIAERILGLPRDP